ncbi:MAG TPA: tRNA adenosine(34) deaminase TadA [Pseudomonadales bacterium]|nr:tRNA adenosine(34) deaminase TadA [Pseudomonadales bacterium]
MDDAYWMRRALQLAELAAEQGEVPVGAIIVRNNEVIGEGWNQPICSHDPTAHAEVIALRRAAELSQNYRLPGTTLYVTLEPCAMCVGAMIHARVGRLVFAAREPKAGAVVSQLQMLELAHFNHRIEVEEGVLAEPCGKFLTQFFRARRLEKSYKNQ